MLRGENPFKNGNQYEPMFYPRSENALHSKNKLNRSRLKSGLANVKFCNCVRQMHRHVRNRGCVAEQRKEPFNNDNISLNSGNHIDIDEVRTIYEFTEFPNGSFHENRHNSKAGDLHTTMNPSTNEPLPGQVWDLEILS